MPKNHHHDPAQEAESQQFFQQVIDDPEVLRDLYTIVTKGLLNKRPGLSLEQKSSVRRLVNFWTHLGSGDPRLVLLAQAGRPREWHSHCFVLRVNRYGQEGDFEGDEVLDFLVDLVLPDPERIEDLCALIIEAAPSAMEQALESAELREEAIFALKARVERVQGGADPESPEEQEIGKQIDGWSKGSKETHSEWLRMRRFLEEMIDELKLRLPVLGIPLSGIVVSATGAGVGDTPDGIPQHVIDAGAEVRRMNEEEHVLDDLRDEEGALLLQLQEVVRLHNRTVAQERVAAEKAERRAQKRAERERRRIAAEEAAARVVLPKRCRDPKVDHVAGARKAVDRATEADRPGALVHLRQVAIDAGDTVAAGWAKAELRKLRIVVDDKPEEEDIPMTAVQAHAVEAVDAQLSLIRWLRNPDAQKMAPTMDGQEAAVAALGISESLNRASTYVVTNDMKAVLFKAAQDYTPSQLGRNELQALHQWDLPSPYGFIYFGASGLWVPGGTEMGSALLNMRLMGIGDNVINIRAMSWYQSHSAPAGIVVSVFIDRDSLNRYLKANNRMNRCTNPLQWFDGMFWDFDKPWFPVPDREEETLEIAQLEHPMTMDEVHRAACDPGMTLYRQILWTFFHLVAERIAVQHHEGLPRAARRRTERAGMAPPEPGTITVIKLRREYQPANYEPGYEPEEAWYSHRFLVSGHWRNQWYPSIQIHQAKYIMGFVKGPEDAPLIIKDKVWSLER
jgi:hypothetical protein